jgi:hypothetical protein
VARRPGWWIGTALRHDSGLVANPDPVAANDPDFVDLLSHVDPTCRPARPAATILDLVSGFDVRRDSRRIWTLQLQVTNLTNRTALYNFQSCSSTCPFSPEPFAVRIRRLNRRQQEGIAWGLGSRVWRTSASPSSSHHAE